MNLSKFFVLNSNQYINENIDRIRPQLMVISKELNNEKSINDFNIILEKMIQNEIIK
ncbi:hypothetical protein Clocel_3307 [Clostridium cellulovorans 743B]|uniref:Uncharacterized protein n=1 Tax=Clostridium cellulovorans (strain ATCC 35296 / DSM 3052 / OCM 3 / 743B) TaxID=573061 RepID=D9SV13_CLOC7|nr:hypothetical protein Clocel_3307 [Clostridium cellulovorans 743B]